MNKKNMVAEAKKRKKELEQELKMVDSFLGLYEKPKNTEVTKRVRFANSTTGSMNDKYKMMDSHRARLINALKFDVKSKVFHINNVITAIREPGLLEDTPGFARLRSTTQASLSRNLDLATKNTQQGMYTSLVDSRG